MQFIPKLRSQQLFAFAGAAMVGGLAFLALLELFCFATWSLARWIHPNPLRAENSLAFAGAPWVTELFHEEDLRLASQFSGYVPFRIRGEGPWHSRYVNNDIHPTGIWRRTDNPEGDQCRAQTNVWMFGGSTLYGTGVPDWATVPSYLSRILNSGGHECVIVTNFGVEAYLTTQELILLLEQLKRGGRPDIVIFYDGFNDANIGMTSPDPWNAHYGVEIIKARIEGSFRGRMDFINRLYTMRMLGAARHLFRRRVEVINPEELHVKAVAVVDNYEANYDIVRALGKAYHFRFYEFWQPMLLYGHKPADSFEQQLEQFDAAHKSRLDSQRVFAVYHEAERRVGKGTFIYLADLFDSRPEPIYYDEAHLGPHGNELVANAIAKYVRDQTGMSALAPPPPNGDRVAYNH